MNHGIVSAGDIFGILDRMEDSITDGPQPDDESIVEDDREYERADDLNKDNWYEEIDHAIWDATVAPDESLNDKLKDITRSLSELAEFHKEQAE